MRVCHGLMTHPHNWVLFAKKIPKPHKQLIINGFLFAKKIPCNKLLVTHFCFYFFRFHPARFYFSVSTSHYTKILQQYGIQPFSTVQYPL